MCAIAGMIGLPAGDPIRKSLLDTMARRGPDGNGDYLEGECCLLHSRLAIIDPEGGAQPMKLCFSSEEYCIVYNGELYNTQEIRWELERKGHTFRSHSDTEVILHAYAEYGESCVDRLNGIFAFAVWEKKAGRLFLARDRIGVKPLFYKLHEGGLLFASELKTILAYPSVKPQLDENGAAQLILLGPGRMPGSGVFRGIQELCPGCCAYYSAGKLQVRRYWKLRDREHTASLEETADHVRMLVIDAIRRQMVADVPIGSFLSGGLDSSIISAVCSRQLAENGAVLQCFSVDYQDNDRYFESGKFQPESDNRYIRIMRDYLGCGHHWTVLTPEELLDSLEESTRARDLPGMADVDFSLLAFCKDVRREVKVALSGECADEIFGGYPWYRDPEIRSAEGFPWAQNTQQRLELMSAPLRRKITDDSMVMDAYRDTCMQSDILPGCDAQARRMKEMINLNFSWFMQTLLDRKDRMSMYSGLEVRVPFCDYRIAEYMYSVPWAYKDYQGREKGLLRYAVEGLLPNSVLYRKKSPYPKTHDPQYARLVRSGLEAVLARKDSPVHHLLSESAVRETLSAEQKWPWYGQLMRQPQTMAYFLQLDYWLRYYRVEMLF